ncbi:MAG: protein phosphatase [Melioribacteraceae bacterium]|nr:MAG: protein phosphatase [Melioribacteraceae bacterium]
MKLFIDAVCDIGAVRKKNEDMVLVADRIFRNDTAVVEINIDELEYPIMLGVSDGMGGHDAGEVASEIVLRKFAEATVNLGTNLNSLQLTSIFNKVAEETHEFIKTEGEKNRLKKGMGATLIGIVFYEGRLFYAGAGDSRLYRFRKGYLRQISKDHSISEIQGLPRERSHLIYNSIGGGESTFIDFHYIGDIILPDDVLLLCSDGLTDMLEDEELEELLIQDYSAEDIVELAKKSGGGDNISLIVVDVFED